MIYKHNPLEMVVCQLRFPPILKIDADIPATFQNRIRGDYPNFSEKSEWRMEIPVPEEVREMFPPEVLQQVLRTTGLKNYEFSSEDNRWKVNLTRTFFALTASKYERWEQFKERLIGPLKALNDLYSPAYYSRIGLRYVDVIRRSTLGLGGVDWSELLESYVLGILGEPTVAEYVQGSQSRYEIRLADGKNSARIITRFVRAVDSADEDRYEIDSDFFSTDKTSISDACRTLDYFNQRASRLIQWCITERLHQAMEPQEL